MHLLASSVYAFSNACMLTEDIAFEVFLTSIVPRNQTFIGKSG